MTSKLIRACELKSGLVYEVFLLRDLGKAIGTAVLRADRMVRFTWESGPPWECDLNDSADLYISGSYLFREKEVKPMPITVEGMYLVRPALPDAITYKEALTPGFLYEFREYKYDGRLGVAVREGDCVVHFFDSVGSSRMLVVPVKRLEDVNYLYEALPAGTALHLTLRSHLTPPPF